MKPRKRQEETAVAKLTALVGHGSGSIGALITITAAFGNVISVTGISLLIMSYLFLRRAQGIREVRDQRSHYTLRNQTPDEQSLLTQLAQADHVVIAHYDVRGKPWRSVVACRNAKRMEGLTRKGAARSLAAALEAADNNQIFFTGGPL